jgi:uncharacterized PurR-regulated membrane protein YhhQ (DUF165 family)
MVSNFVSGLIESVVFLTLALGGLPEIRTVIGLMIGKFAASAVTLAAIAWTVRLRAPDRNPGTAHPERAHEGGA